jgi:hypothetical protein
LRDAQSETFDEVYEHVSCKRKREERRGRRLKRRGVGRIYV